MLDNPHPTNPEWVLYDPLEKPAPRGCNLVLINEHGVLILGQWYEGALAWGFKPKIPDSVKLRVSQRLQKQQEESGSTHGSQPEVRQSHDCP